MTYLLDTNICSAYLKRPGLLAPRFIQHTGRLSISTIVLAELYTWAFRRSDPIPLLNSITQEILIAVEVIDFDTRCARMFGELRATMMSAGAGVHPTDLMIAAVARVHDLTLVTHNVRHFSRIPELRIDNWLEP